RRSQPQAEDDLQADQAEDGDEFGAIDKFHQHQETGLRRWLIRCEITRKPTRIALTKAMYQEVGAPIIISPPFSEDRTQTPTTGPQTEPMPPLRVQPPITQAAMDSSSIFTPEVE